jgi:predicted nucleic acid-binding protein
MASARSEHDLVLRPTIGRADCPVDQLLAGNIDRAEVLQGARREKDTARLEVDLRQFPIVAMADDGLAAKAARHYRIMRSFGFTMKIADLLIGTFCIERGHDLLHCDSDFDAMEKFSIGPSYSGPVFNVAAGPVLPVA